MNQQIATKWAEALESGKYKQGQGALRNDNNEFCCLGVLCDILAPDEWRKDDSNLIFGRRYKHLDGAETMLPDQIAIQAMMNDVAGNFRDRKHPPLWDLNDGVNIGEGKTFKEIAKIIREEWKNL